MVIFTKALCILLLALKVGHSTVLQAVAGYIGNSSKTRCISGSHPQPLKEDSNCGSLQLSQLPAPACIQELLDPQLCQTTQTSSVFRFNLTSHPILSPKCCSCPLSPLIIGCPLHLMQPQTQPHSPWPATQGAGFLSSHPHPLPARQGIFEQLSVLTQS